jgi:hypothetical protein
MEWIKCEDRLPEEDQNIIVYIPKFNDNHVIMEGIYQGLSDDGKENIFSDQFTTYHYSNVTHWMPMPLPPEE